MKVKLYKASFRDAPENSGCWSSSSDDGEVFIMATSIGEASLKAEVEFKKWQTDKGEKWEKVLECVKLLSEKIIA